MEFVYGIIKEMENSKKNFIEFAVLTMIGMALVGVVFYYFYTNSRKSVVSLPPPPTKEQLQAGLYDNVLVSIRTCCLALAGRRLAVLGGFHTRCCVVLDLALKLGT